MKKSLIKNNLKEISKTRRRFISILIMAFLGVGFYAGLTASSPDMLDSLDSYTDNNKMYDINVISTLGLTDDDVNAIKQIDGIDEVYGLQTKDVLSTINDKEDVCKIIEYNPNINCPTVVAGKMPESSNECLLDKRYTITEDVNDLIGKKIIIENTDTNEDDTPIITQKELTIVGIADTPIYISSERGNTSIGNGSVKYFIYVKDDVINLDYYTEICATVKDARKYVTNSEEYLNKVNPVISKVESIKEEREEARYNDLINEANTKLNDAQQEYDSKKVEVENELNDAETQINNAKTELTSSEEKLKKTESEISLQEANANKQFSNAEAEITNAQATLNSKENELAKGREQFNAQKAEAQAGIENIDTLISQTQTNLNTLENQKKAMIEAGQTDTSQVDALIYQATVAIQNLKAQKEEITNNLAKDGDE